MWKPPKSSFDNSITQYEVSSSDAIDNEEEEDYMSDAFLSKCGNTCDDIRPGVPMSYSMKRKLQIQKKKEQNDIFTQKNKKFSQKERLDEGLNTALSQDNKGFSMLQKMGYRPGTSLGKTGDGHIEPIKVEVKTDRGGLGLKEQLMEQKREKEQRYLAKIQKLNLEFDPDRYREQKRQQLLAKRVESDLLLCQRTCYRLDSEQNIIEPMDWYFWPSHLLPKDEEEEEEEDANAGGDDEEGAEGGDWAELKEGREGAPAGSHYSEHEDVEPWQTEIQVEVVTTYMRRAYYYCIWCGTTYDGEEDMNRNCPGMTRQDHDD